MATSAQLQQEITILKADLGPLKASRDAVIAEINTLADQKAALKSERQQLYQAGDIAGSSALRAQETQLSDKIDNLYQTTAYTGFLAAQSKVTKLEANLSVVQDKEAFDAKQLQNQPPATASQAAADDAAKGPNAPDTQQITPNGRVVSPPDTTSSSNATIAATLNTGGGDLGTDGVKRTTEQLLGTGPFSNSGQALAVPGAAQLGALAQTGSAGLLAQAKLITKPGTVTNDDKKSPTTAATNQAVEVDDYTNIKISPRANPLDSYHSYTYSISVYMLTPKQYEILVNSKNKKIDGYFLLFQSGGAGPNIGGAAPGQGETAPNGIDRGRNPFFGDDFYIDSFSLTTLPLGGNTGASQSSTEIKMTVVEPQGMTLIDRLYKAAENLQPKDGAGVVSYAAVNYLSVIRFYGYDEGGNVVYPIRSMGEVSGTTDPKAVIEKFIPFVLKKINWSVGSKAVNYDWECAAIGQFVGIGRGEIPYDVQLTDQTVAGLLGGTAAAAGANTVQDPQQRAEAAQIAAAAPPSNAVAAPTAKKTITQGLMSAMNDFQKSLVDRGIFKFADEYSLEFKSDVPGVPASAIANATLKPIGQVKDDKAKTAGGQAAAENPQSLNQATNTVDSVSQSMSITAGQNITQVIELAIRNSSYIQDQQVIIVNPDGTWTPNPNSRDKPVSWYIITMFATPKPGGIDPLRGDYAYKIKYVVQPFIPQNLISKYFPVSSFAGLHKKYPYWFTGQNVAVLDYKETMNALYTLTVSGSDPKNGNDSGLKENYSTRLSDIVQYNQTDTIKFQYSPRSNQPSAGQKGKINEPAANAADYLFSPSDLKTCVVRIIGDPDWIQQGSLFKDIKPGENKVAARTGFGEDGSISFENTDILFEMLWQRPEDYNINTGLADPYSGGYSGNANGTREAVQSRVYKARKVVSEFKGGKFEQTLDGAIYLFPRPKAGTTGKSGEGKMAEAGAGRGSANDPRRLDQPNQTANTEIRTGLNLTPAAALAARGNEITDPRSSQSADGGKAAILGAQGAFSNLGIANGIASKATIEPAALAAFGSTLLPAAPPLPPTSGTGGAIGAVAESVGFGPPKLPQVLSGQAGLTDTQIAVQVIQAAASTGLRLGAVAGSTGGPSTQQIAKDF